MRTTKAQISLRIRAVLSAPLLFAAYYTIYAANNTELPWWQYPVKELSSWLFACAAFLYAVLIVCLSFSFGVCGRMLNVIVSVPDHSLPFRLI